MKLTTPAVSIQHWRTEGFMESWWSSAYEVDSIPVKECHSNNIIEPASRRARRQKLKFSSSISFYLGCHQKGLPILKVDLPVSNLINTVPSSCVLVDYRCRQIAIRSSHHRNRCLLSSRCLRFTYQSCLKVVWHLLLKICFKGQGTESVKLFSIWRNPRVRLTHKWTSEEMFWVLMPCFDPIYLIFGKSDFNLVLFIINVNKLSPFLSGLFELNWVYLIALHVVSELSFLFHPWPCCKKQCEIDS